MELLDSYSSSKLLGPEDLFLAFPLSKLKYASAYLKNLSIDSN